MRRRPFSPPSLAWWPSGQMERCRTARARPRARKVNVSSSPPERCAECAMALAGETLRCGGEVGHRITVIEARAARFHGKGWTARTVLEPSREMIENGQLKDRSGHRRARQPDSVLPD